MSKKNDAEILKVVMQALKLRSAKALAEKLSYKSTTSIYKVLTNGKNIPDSMKSRIVTSYPQVNMNFLNKGEGEPLKFISNLHAPVDIIGGDTGTLEGILMVQERIDAIETKLDKILANQEELLVALRPIIRKKLNMKDMS